MGKRRLGITVRPIEKGTSGSGKHLSRLLRAFVDINRDFDLFFIAHTEKQLPLYEFGQVVQVPRQPLAASRILQKVGLDGIHYSPLSIFSPIFVRGVKRCATMHPDDEFIVPEIYSRLRRLHAHMVVKQYARRLDLIFTVSRTSRQLLVDKLGIRPERIRLTFNAVDERFRLLEKTSLEEARSRYGLPERFLLHVSHFSERKNPWTTLKAMAELRRRDGFGDCKLAIVGKGWQESPDVARFVEDNSLGSSIVFCGFIPTEDLPRLYNLASVFIFPSICEGFGIPNLEAMACGCPVVTSRCFAIPEVVGDAAHLLDDERSASELADAVAGILRSAAMADRLREAGLKRVQDFSWENSARELLAGYRQLLEN